MMTDLDGFRVVDLPPYCQLEPYTSEPIPRDTNALAAGHTISAVLKNMNISFEEKPLKGKWKCSYGNNGAFVVFHLRIWRQMSADLVESLVFEAHRRSGSIPTFMRLYRDILAGMKEANFHPEQVAATEATAAAASPVQQVLVAEDVAENDMTAFVASLKEMVASGQVDAVLEGTRALAQLSADQDERWRLCTAIKDLESIFDDNLPATFGQFGVACEFFAVSCFANLSEEPTLHEQLPLKLLFSLIRHGNYVDVTMRREAARAIRNVANENVGDFISGVGGRSVLANWHHTTYGTLADDAMRNDVDQVMLCVEAWDNLG